MSRSNFGFNIEQFFNEAKNDQVEEQFEDELGSFSDLVGQHYDLKFFLEDPRIAAEVKKQRLEELCPPNISRNFLRLVFFLIDNGREELIEEASLGLTKLVAQEKEIMFGRVSSFFPLSEKQKAALIKSMSAIEKMPVRLRYVIDGSLLGGFNVRFINGRVWDTSIKYRLNNLKEELLR
ncbi:MAG: ATP synthase F1 subunit delta [bacterium]